MLLHRNLSFHFLNHDRQFLLAFLLVPTVDTSGDAFAVGVSGSVFALPEVNFSQKFNKIERLNFILACYNAGYSRIADARRLTRHFEENAGRWSVVSTYLPLLAEPEYAEHEAVHGGPFHGSAETIAYVKAVMRVYKRYQRIVDEATKSAEEENKKSKK